MNTKFWCAVLLLGTAVLLAAGCTAKPPVVEAQPPVVTEPPPPPPPPVVEQPPPPPVELRFQPIYFDFDKYNLKPEAKERLKVNADLLKQNADAQIVIEGHCDERGTQEYNLALGDRRAQAARRFLLDMGITPARLKTISYGEERPVDPGHTEAAWAKNRRAEFKRTDR